MNIKGEIKVLSSIAKKIVDKRKIKKINKIKDFSEQLKLYEYVIKRELESKVLDFRGTLKKLELKNKDVFFIKIKVNLLKLKIHYFIIGFKKKEFRKIMKLIKVIERDLKNV